MFIEMAVGDAYGAAFEFTKTPAIPNDLSRYGSHPKGELPEAAFTDDTLRAVANARVLLSGDEDDAYRAEAYAQAYLDAHALDHRKGWSTRFQQILEQHRGRHGMDLMRTLRRSPTNGCLMGVAPLGFLPTIDQVRLAATVQTVSTHAGSAVPYAQVVAIAAHHLLHGGTTLTVLDHVVEEVEWADARDASRFRALVSDEPPVPAMPAHTIAAGALWALTHFDSCGEALRWTCSRAGDTDSLGAVTMALAACAADMVQDLPDHLLQGVDTEENRTMLHALDADLARRFDIKGTT
jgi:ADP-ribosylglycohydrolase